VGGKAGGGAFGLWPFLMYSMIFNKYFWDGQKVLIDVRL